MQAGWSANLVLVVFGVTLVLTAALGLRLLVRRDPVMRYRIGRVTLLTVLFLPAAQLLPVVFGADAAWTPIASMRTTMHSLPLIAPTAATAGSGRSGPVAGVSEMGAAEQAGIDTTSIATIVYSFGLVLVLGCGLLRIVSGWRLVNRARAEDDEQVLSKWRAIRAAIAGRRSISLLRSGEVTVPGSWGLGRPAVLLPEGETWDAGQLGCVLMHECIHIVRRDAWFAGLQIVLSGLWWFHPLIHVFGRMLGRDRELSCDALVVERTGQARTYALALLACEASRPCPTGRGIGLVHGMGTLVPVRRRLEMLESAQGVSLRRRVVTTVLLAGVMGCCLLVQSAASVAMQPQGDDAEGSPGVPIVIPTEGYSDVLAAVHAPTWGRSAKELLQRFEAMAHHLGVRAHALGGSVTDGETMVHAYSATIRKNSLEAKEITINLPEGSNLTAMFVGAEMVVRTSDRGSIIELRDGELSVADSSGVHRLTARAAAKGGVLRVRSSTPNGEISMELSATAKGRSVPVHLEMDLTTGVPEVGEGEDPPHNSVRYDLQATDRDDEPSRIKMYWHYHIPTLLDEVGDDESSAPWRGD